MHKCNERGIDPVCIAHCVKEHKKEEKQVIGLLTIIHKHS